MHLPTALRDLRRQHGWSVRAAASRCDVPQSTWADWETGASSPSVARLCEALRRIDRDLRIDDRPPPEPPGEQQVVRHLRRSLTQRARMALGDHLAGSLAACSAAPRLLTGPAAVGVWVPYAVARAVPPLPPAPWTGAHVVLRLDRQEPQTRPALAAVPTPAALVADGAAESWPLLPISVRLLAAAGRDFASRRLPPHRDPDEAREVRDLLHTLTWGGRGALPVQPTDSRAWRLDAPATLDALLVSKGFPPRNASRRPGQPR